MESPAELVDHALLEAIHAGYGSELATGVKYKLRVKIMPEVIVHLTPCC